MAAHLCSVSPNGFGPGCILETYLNLTAHLATFHRGRYPTFGTEHFPAGKQCFGRDTAGGMFTEGRERKCVV